MHLAGDPPPVCTVCNQRIRVAAKTIDCPVHFQCRYNNNRVTEAELRKRIPDLVDTWHGLKQKTDSVTRLCKVHGKWSQSIISAINGHNCQQCYSENRLVKYTRQNWIDDFVSKHGTRYSYDHISDLIKAQDKVDIQCDVHGIFQQQASLHKSGHGCPRCASDIQGQQRRLSQAEFIERGSDRFNGKYNYDKVQYTGMNTSLYADKVVITCPDHGDFEQAPSVHLSSVYGCPRCAYENIIVVNRSAGEKEVEQFLRNCGFRVESSYRKLGFEIDIFLPDVNVGIEYNGSYWHSELQGRDRRYHVNKTNRCEEHGIHLIHIWDFQWTNKQDLIKSRLRSKLQQCKVIYGRKTVISDVASDTSLQFQADNHIQGQCRSTIAYGLYYESELVALMTFGKSRYKKDIKWELIRYCSKQGTNVVGGASRLLKHFTSRNNGNIISYSCRLWNTGGLYRAIGFSHSRRTSPSYFYTNDYCTFENRVAYQKHKLKDKLMMFDEKLTEWENMQNNGFDRIWDCGTDVWEYQCPTTNRNTNDTSIN